MNNKVPFTILKRFTLHKPMLFNCLTTKSQLCLRLHMKLKEKESNITTKTNASKITNSTCTSKSR